MLETLFKRKKDVERHCSAPLLQERDRYLENKAKKGLRDETLQSSASIILFAVEGLGLNGICSDPVPLESVNDVFKKWMDCHKPHAINSSERANASRRFLSETLAFLDQCGMLDSRFEDKENVFNKLIKRYSTKVMYFCGPMYEERVSFLNHLLSKGKSLSKVKDYFAIQLEVANLLTKSGVQSLSRGELASYAQKLCESGSVSSSNFRTYENRFVGYGRQWIRYMKAQCAQMVNPLPEYMERFLTWCSEEKGLYPVTITNRRRQLRYFVEYLKETGIEPSEAGAEAVEAYLLKKTSAGLEKSSILASLATIRAYYRWAYESCQIEFPIHEYLKAPKSYRLSSLPEPVSWDDVQRVCNYYDGEDPISLRNNAIVNILAAYGLRSGEVASLMLDSIDWDKDTLTVALEKRGGQVLLPLIPHVGNLILRYLIHGRPETDCDSLFVNVRDCRKGITADVVYYAVSKAYDALGIESKSRGGHSIRHALATKLVNDGHTLQEVGGILGHKNPDTTMIYTKVDLRNLGLVANIDVEGLL